jgi:hypothetical protein
MVLRSMTLYSLVIRPKIHAVTRCLHLHRRRGEYEGSSFNRNVGNYQTKWCHTPECCIILTAVKTWSNTIRTLVNRLREFVGGKTVEYFLTLRNIQVINLGSLNRNERWTAHVAYTIPVCNSRRMWILRGPACSREEDIDLSRREVSCEHISCTVLWTGLRLHRASVNTVINLLLSQRQGTCL